MQPTSTTKLIEPSIHIKHVYFRHGEPLIQWKSPEVKNMNSIENLDFVIVGKFSYGWSEIQELRILIPNQYGIKYEVQIGLLCYRHVLIR